MTGSGQRLLECVPNLSTADPALRDAAAEAAIADDDRVVLLDRSSDRDHGRSVLTLAGDEDAVGAAAVRLARFACDHIDLRAHAGVHRRMGALDVCPFVPLVPDRMPAAIAVARCAAEQIADLGIPVFLYAEAREHEGRRVLGAVRNLGFEELVRRVDRGELRPDRGPVQMHPSAGAVAVGARPFLIAWNVELEPPADLGAARAVARSVRESSGGLPGVQAMGFWLEQAGVAQVSCNLLDAGRAAGGIAVVFDAIVEHAATVGARVRRSELIGLAPADALDVATAAHIRLPDFDPSRHTVEGRLRSAWTARPSDDSGRTPT